MTITERTIKTPKPYSFEEMGQLLARTIGTEWELIVVLGGLYGLRLNEILGLRWSDMDNEMETFGVVEQLPFALPTGTTYVTEMVPVKSGKRTLPVTDMTIPFFWRQLMHQINLKISMKKSREVYYDNDLVIAKPNGCPEREESVSANFSQFLRQQGLRHIRFHDLCYSAATNMHELTEDFNTVEQILGHSLKSGDSQLGISSNLQAVAVQYTDDCLDRKSFVLNAYHEKIVDLEVLYHHPRH